MAPEAEITVEQAQQVVKWVMEDKKQYIELADIGQTKKALLSIVDHEPLILYHDDLHPEERVLVCSDNHARELKRAGVIFEKDQAIQDRSQVAPPGEMI